MGKGRAEYNKIQRMRVATMRKESVEYNKIQ